MEDGSAFYVKQGNVYIIKLVGNIRYTMGCALNKFLDDLFARGDYDDIVVDLTETRSVDSTSLGLLAKIANFSQHRFAHKTTLLSTNPDVNQLLDSMGFYEIFDVRDTGAPLSSRLQQLAIEELCKEDLTRIIFEAHSTLSDISAHNREIFGDVVENLRSKLGKA